MSILALLFWIVLIGVGTYLVNLHVPMEGWIKTVFNVVVVIVVILLLLHAFGGADFLSSPIPRVR